MIRIVTSSRIMADPAPTPVALRFVDALLAAPRARRVAALALSHGCRLATADRGFARFDDLDWFVPVEPTAGG